MSKLVFFAVFLCFALASYSCHRGVTTLQPNRVDLQSGLMAYYPFDGTSADMSGNKKDADPIGTYSYVNGFQGQAIRLVGDNTTFHTTGGYVQLPMIDTTGLNELTISMWIKDDSMFSGGEAYVYFGTDCNIGWCGMGHFDSFYNFSVGSDNLTTMPLIMPFDSSLIGQWTHYVLVYANGLFSVYRNSVLMGSLAQRLYIYGNRATIGSREWGGAYAGYSSRMIGDVDEVRIYRRALSVSEIAALYQGAK